MSAIDEAGRTVGGDRFVIQRRLGAGGMGVVYQALDRERNQVVALKTLRDLDAAALVRFKNEFRALADVRHPNLVALYELVSTTSDIFFTMELVEGEALSAPDVASTDRSGAARRDDRALRHRRAGAMTQSTQAGKRGLARRQRPTTPRAPTPPSARSRRSTCRACARAAAARRGRRRAARAGKLHRDLKPSNVLVTARRARRDPRLRPGDRAWRGERSRRSDGALVGTAAYMAPEQGARLPLGAASDWYAVGVMLYEALTGRLPFVGRSTDVLMDKQQSSRRRRASSCRDVPRDLDALCIELLRRDPAARPAGHDVLRRLGGDHRRPSRAAPSRSSSRPAPLFVGRERAPRGARAARSPRRARGTRRRRASSTATRAWARARWCAASSTSAEAQRARVVLSGRCYERERCPTRRVDSLIDALSQHLAQLPPHRGRGAPAARRAARWRACFPVLRQVEAVTAAPRRGGAARRSARAAPARLRRAARALARIADGARWCSRIDDLQWGDADGGAARRAHAAARRAGAAARRLPPHRGSAATARFCARCSGSRRRARSTARASSTSARSSGPRAAAGATLLGVDGPRELSTRRSASPRRPAATRFFIDELARHARDGAAGAGRRCISLDEVLRARLRRLPAGGARGCSRSSPSPAARSPLAVAQRAAEVDRAAGAGAAQAANLVRTRGAADAALVESYHDRVREAVLRAARRRAALRACTCGWPSRSSVAARRRRGAGRALRAAPASTRAPPSTLPSSPPSARPRRSPSIAPRGSTASRSSCGRRRARRERARRCASRSATRSPTPAAAPRRADAYLAAAAGADRPAEALDLRRRAAEQLLRSGHIDEGIAALQRRARARRHEAAADAAGGAGVAPAGGARASRCAASASSERDASAGRRPRR